MFETFVVTDKKPCDNAPGAKLARTEDKIAWCKAVLKAGEVRCPPTEYARFMCCKVKYASFEKLQAHIDANKATHIFKCSQCGQAFPRKESLTRHENHLHNDPVKKRCRFCHIVLATERELRRHCDETHREGRPFACDHDGCDYQARQYYYLRKHKLQHIEVKTYICDKCGRDFKYLNSFDIHRRACYKLKENLCDICGQAFNHIQDMKRHRANVHFKEKPYKCPDCGKLFADHCNMRRHRRIHLNQFPYGCQLCEKKFRHSNSLKSHMRTHDGSKN